jgi:hypothetical protein
MLEVGFFLHLPSNHKKKDYQCYVQFASPLVSPPAKMAKRAGKGECESARKDGGTGEEMGGLLVDEMGNELQHM